MHRFCRLSLLFAFLCVLFSPVSRAARSEYPVFEGFLGASVINGTFDANRLTMPGLHFGLALNPKSYLRLTTEFSAHYQDTGIRSNLSAETVRLSEYHFLSGPEFIFRGNARTLPFIHSMFGIAARHYTIPSNDPQFPRDVLAVEYGFATAFGGGIDIPLSRRWSFRAIQYDYLLTHLKQDQPQFSPIQNQLPALKAWQQSHRFSFGITLRLGNHTK